MYPWRFSRDSRESYLQPSTSTPYTDKNNINEFNHKRKRKDWQKVTYKEMDHKHNKMNWNEAYTSDPKEAKETAESRLQSLMDSLRDRGHARESIAYNPPDDVQARILSLYRNTKLGDGSSSTETDEDILSNVDLNANRELKFELIKSCIEAFGHDLPTSCLNDMQYIRDLVEYYSQPVRGINPYEMLLSQDRSLPANLCLLPEPIRFDRETDQFFKGKSAYPGLVSKVPGLRRAKKFPILNQEDFQWPDI